MSDIKYLNALSVDCIIFGFDEGELKVLLIKRKEEPSSGMWALPGGFVESTESLDHAAMRVLRELTSIPDMYMEQVYAFGEVNRYPAGRVISVSYYALVKISDYKVQATSKIEDVAWHPLSEITKLVFDHNSILEKALTTLKERVKFHPVGFELLPEKFTLTQLQNLYEVILGVQLDKRNFRKKLLGMDLIVKLEESQVGVAHRAARYFKFDPVRYKEWLAQGFNFKL
jgi:8-oxo-dGTP diphosphatase